MKYNGQELEPITKPQVFNPPKEMLVWDVEYKEPVIEPVCAITGSHHYQVVTCSTCYDYCAKIPKREPKRATKLQLTEWVAKGNGVWKFKNANQLCFAHDSCFEDDFHKYVDDDILILPFGTTEWLEPTLQNMGMEDK